jgi:hypothetical protein
MKSKSIVSIFRCSATAIVVAALVGLLNLGPIARFARADDAAPAGTAPIDQKSSETKPSTDAQFYKVQVLHPAKVGDRLHMKRDIEETTTQAAEMNGQPRGTQTSATQLNFTANLEVMSVDTDGNPEKWKVSGGVAGLKGNGSAGRSSLIKPNTEFTVSFSEGKAIVESDSQHPLSEDAKKLLPYVFNATGGKGDTTLDELIDNATASRTASWVLNQKALLAQVHEFDTKVKESDITSSARIKAVNGDGDKKTLMVEYKYSASGKNPTNPPEGMKPVSDSLIASGTLTIPADGSTGYFSSKVQTHTTGVFQKTETKKQTIFRYGIRQTKDVPVHDQIKIDQIDHISTVITYGSGGEEKKKSQQIFSSDSSASSASPASAAAK